MVDSRNSISPAVKYDEIAATYDRRYSASPLAGVGAALEALVQQSGARRLLEAGCGTGHWLELLEPKVEAACGLDLSAGMLALARLKGAHMRLVAGRATRLPFGDDSFDLVFCVNAIHHFGDPRRFIFEAGRCLKPGGALAVAGLNPHDNRDSWYVYNYFEGAYQTDIQRFPTGSQLQGWLEEAGFERLEWRIAEQIERSWYGRDVYNDPFLKKESTSQLTLLSDEVYAAGIRRIEADLQAAEAQGRVLEFRSDLLLLVITGFLRKS